MSLRARPRAAGYLVGLGLQAAATRRPRRTALVSAGRRIPFSTLNRAVDRVGRSLLALGLEPGSRIALALPDPVDFLTAFMAAARWGFVAVAAPHDGPDAELAAALQETSTAAVLAAGPEQAHAGLQEALGGVRWLGWEELPLPPYGSPPHGSPGSGSWGRQGARFPAAPSQPRRVRPDDLFFVGCTSGSTGRPRGVARRHENWALSFEAATAELGLRPFEERFLVVGPLYFSAPLFHACHLLEIGGTVHLLPRFSPRAVLMALGRHRLTGLFMVPTHYAALLETLPEGRPAPRTLRTLISCGEKLQPALRRALQARFAPARVFEYYGSSELGFTTLLPPGPWPAESVGRPFRGVEVAIRRPDGAAAPPGEAGVLYARSPYVAAGYTRADGTLQPLAGPGGWATAGDLARRERGGAIYLEGRLDDAINAGGATVNPAEVEAALAEHPAVAEVAAFPLPDARRGQVVAAAVVLRTSPSARLPAGLRAWAARRLAPYKRPRRWFVVAELPRNPSGKVDRRALQERFT